MGDPRGFVRFGRAKGAERPVAERIGDSRELALGFGADVETLRTQASRCMDCGIPFCHQGCPLANLIPEWNDLVYRGEMGEAIARLHATNNFPEMTGRVCPAPCEASCVLGIEDAAVTIKEIERAIADAAFAEDAAESALAPMRARSKSGKTVAVIGSGPAGLAAAQELARLGHDVTVLEKDDRIGGLLRYGIPDFKLEKALIDRRLDQLRAEGVTFRTGVDVGGDDGPSVASVCAEHDAVVLAVGARRARELDVPGRDLAGVVLAMEYLTQQNRRVAGDPAAALGAPIVATGKRVVVIGGGDTGADCVGTAIRQGAASVTQLELMPKPGLARAATNPWPEWPLVLRTSTSHDEGATRDWAVMTRALRAGADGAVAALEAVRVEVIGRDVRAVAGAELALPCELVLLAMGFVGPEERIAGALGLGVDARGNVLVDATGATSRSGVFAAGDASRGASLVVWAIADGRRVAAGVHAFLARGAPSGAVSLAG